MNFCMIFEDSNCQFFMIFLKFQKVFHNTLNHVTINFLQHKSPGKGLIINKFSMFFQILFFYEPASFPGKSDYFPGWYEP